MSPEAEPRTHTRLSVDFFDRRVIPLSLAATAVATAMLHGAYDGDMHVSPIWGHPTYWTDEHVERVTQQERPLGNGAPGNRIVNAMVHRTAEQPVTRLHFNVAPYAPDFSASPEAQEVSHHDELHLHDVLVGLRKAGWHNLQLRIHGIASAEDNTPDGLAGVTTSSHPNQKLANKRGTVLAESFEQSRLLPKAVGEQVIKGVEEHFTPGQVDVATHLAKQYHYADVGVMVKAWHAGEAPKAVGKVLGAWLGKSHHGAEVEIFGSRTVTTTTEEPKLERVCVVPVEVTKTKYVRHSDRKFPFPAFIPIIVPIVRRRQVTETVETVPLEPESAPLPEASVSRPTGADPLTGWRASWETPAGPTPITPEAATELTNTGYTTPAEPEPESVAVVAPMVPNPEAVGGEPELAEPAEESEPEAEKTAREPWDKRKLHWLWLLPIAAGLGFLGHSCAEGSSHPKPTTTAPAPNPCAHLPKFNESVQTITNTVVVK